MVRQKRAQPGYFLIELLIVLALFGMVCGMGIYTTTFFNRLLIRSELQKLEMVCRALQWRAIASGQAQALTFDVSKNTYTYNNTHSTLPRQLVFGVVPGVKGPPASPTHIITNPITFVDGTITFASTGIMSSGTVYIKDSAHTALYALTNAVSGYSLMRLYGYAAGKWNLI